MGVTRAAILAADGVGYSRPLEAPLIVCSCHKADILQCVEARPLMKGKRTYCGIPLDGRF